jgi:hypothetical protein
LTSWRNDAHRLSRLAAEAIRAAVLDAPLPAASDHPLGTVDGCRDMLAAGGWRDVEVREVRHDLVVPDPPAFFRSLSEWSAPVVPLVAGLTADQLDAAADAFTAVVRRHGPEPDRVPFTAYLSTGTAGHRRGGL